jgi:hypothetical protein
LSMNGRVQLGYHVGTWEVLKPASQTVRLQLWRQFQGTVTISALHGLEPRRR